MTKGFYRRYSDPLARMYANQDSFLDGSISARQKEKVYLPLNQLQVFLLVELEREQTQFFFPCCIVNQLLVKDNTVYR